MSLLGRRWSRPADRDLKHCREAAVQFIYDIGRDNYLPALRAWCEAHVRGKWEIFSAVSVWFEFEADANRFAATWSAPAHAEAASVQLRFG